MSSNLRLLLTLLLILPTILAAAPLPPTMQIVRIYLDDPADTDALVAMNLDLLEARGPDYLLALASPYDLIRLRRAGWRVVPDAAHTANLQVAALPQAFRDGYLTVSEVEARLQELAETYPALAQRVDYGDSWEKTQDPAAGHDLWALRLTRLDRTQPKPVFLLFASVHPRELATTEVALRFAEALLSGYGSDPDATWLLDYQEIWIIPIANPDGHRIVEEGYYQRKNTNRIDAPCDGWPLDPYSGAPGVDLNRNSSFQWGGPGSSNAPCAQTYRGSRPASEPEAAALQALMSALFSDRRPDDLTTPAPEDTSGIVISLHSFGRLILRPWAFSWQLPPNADDLRRLGDYMGALSGYYSCQTGMSGCLYAASGTNDDWAYGALGVPAFTIELGDQFFEPYTAVEPLWQTIAPALFYAARVARAPYLLSRGPDTIAVDVPSIAYTDQTITITARLSSIGSSSPITGGEAFLDAPPWSNAPAIPLRLTPAKNAPGEVLLSGTLDVGTLSPGRHLLFVRGVNADGYAGPPRAAFLEVRARSLPYRLIIIHVQVSRMPP